MTNPQKPPFFLLKSLRQVDLSWMLRFNKPKASTAIVAYRRGCNNRSSVRSCRRVRKLDSKQRLALRCCVGFGVAGVDERWKWRVGIFGVANQWDLDKNYDNLMYSDCIPMYIKYLEKNMMGKWLADLGEGWWWLTMNDSGSSGVDVDDDEVEDDGSDDEHVDDGE